MFNPTSSQAAANGEDVFSAYIPFSSQVSEHVVSTKDGDYMSTWKLAGLDFLGLSVELQNSRMDALNLLIRGLADGHYAFWVHRIRRRVADTLTVPDQAFARDLLSKYYKAFDNGGLFEIEHYLTLIYRPTPQAADKLIRASSSEDEASDDAEAITILDDLHLKVGSLLNQYKPTRLGNYASEGVTFSRQLEFYGYLINGHWWKIPVKPLPLYKYLPVSRLFFGKEFIERRDAYGSVYSAFIDIKDYADYTSPGILNALLGVGVEYVETHSFSPFPPMQAISNLTLQRNRMRSAGDHAVSQREALTQAIDGIAGGDFAMGEYHYLMQVFGASIDEVSKARAKVIESLQRVGFLAHCLDMVADCAYFSQFPGNWRYRPRVARLTSRNAAGLFSMHGFASGKRDGNPWGEAVTILRSPSGQPYYFNFHASTEDSDSFGQSALGNTQVIGQSGAGKTALVLFLVMNLLKYGTRCVYFDKDRGAEIALRAAGGKYYSLERGKPTGLNPFKLDPDQKTIQFWEDLVKRCTQWSERAHTPQEEAHMAHAVRAVALLPRQARCFEAVLQNLPNPLDPNSLGARLLKWCSVDKLGWLLNNEDDQLSLEGSQVYGFDYTEILDDPIACSALMMYLLFRVECMLDGRRFAFVIDEYWKALSDPYFEEFAKNKQKTIRKQNGFGVFLTQSPSDTLANPIAKTLIEQTATFIFLPNPTADHNDYVKGFKLSEREYDIIKSLGESSRQFLIKQGTRTALVSLDLSDFSKELRVLSGTTQNVLLVEQLRALHGDAPEAWLPHFLK